MQFFLYPLLALAAGAPRQGQEPEPAGYSLLDPFFAGQYEDLLLHRLELTDDGDAFHGRCVFGSEYEITAQESDGRLEGTARSGDGEQQFLAEWDGDRLRVLIGEQLLWLSRTVAPLAVDLGAPREDPERQWTIAVYMGADNNLEAGGLLDLSEMAQGMPAQGVEVIALIDRAKEEWTDADGDWTDSAVFRMRHEQDPELIGEIGEPDMTDPATLAGFVTSVFQAFPAQHHAVILWDHGGGWQGLIEDADAPGKEGTQLMDLAALRLGLHTALLHSRVLQLDLVAFDACLMSHLEVAVGLADLAQYMVASQASVAGTGFPYEQVLPLFAGGAAARDVAVGIVQAFGQYYENEHDAQATLFAIDLSRVGKVAALLDQLALEAGNDPDAPALARSLYYAECYQPRTERTAPGALASVDLVDLLQRMRRSAPSFPAATAQALEQAVAEAVIAAHTGDERRLSHGLSIYGPHKSEQMRFEYLLNWLGGASHWTGLLAQVQEAVAADPVPVQLADLRVLDHEGQLAAAVPQFGGCALHATVTGNSIVQVQQWDSTRDGEHWLVLRKNFVVDPNFVFRVREAAAEDVDLVMPQFVDGRNELQSELTGMNFAVSNGELQVLATLDMAAPSTSAPVLVRARMREPGVAEATDIAIEFDRFLWLAQTVYDLTPAADGRVEPRLIAPAADAQISVLLETLEDDGSTGEIENDAIPWKGGLRLILTQDDPGRYRADLVAETMDGRLYADGLEYELAANPDLERWQQSWESYNPARLTGTWRQSVAVGPEQFHDTGSTAEFLGPHPLGPGCFRVRTRFTSTPGGQGEQGEQELEQIWILEQFGVPNLRIVVPTADGRTLCWFGPAVIGASDGKPFLAMKVLNFGGVIWRWEGPPAGN